MWAVVPSAAKKWAHNRKTRKPDWTGARARKRPSLVGAVKSMGRRARGKRR